ncbi:MAG TPA: MFS transporter [Chloroflexi bacterium]|nr:MFS transporter [Chloroflexota bacterium]
METETVATRRPTSQRQAAHNLLRQRDFALLWAGQLLSQVGDQCLLIAAITLITDLSASPLAILVPAISMALPQVFFGLLGGVVADRWSRKWVMVISDLLRALLVLTVLLVQTTGQLWILYLAAGGLALVGTFFYPARNAAIPNLVPNGLLLAANGLIQGSYIIALILGPTVAGAAVELWGMKAAILFDSGTFLVSAAAILAMHIPSVSNRLPNLAVQRSMWHDMRTGLTFIRRSRPLRRVLYVTSVATLGIGAVVLLAIPHLKARLGAGGLEYGGAMSMLGIGSVMGGLVVTRLSRRLSTNSIIGGMLVVAGAAIITFAYTSHYTVVLVSVMMLGLCIVIARGALDTITQTLAPDEIRGRVQAAVNLVVVAGTALAEGLSAFLGHFLGVQTVFVAAGVITAVAGVASVYALRERGRTDQTAATPSQRQTR